MRKLMMVAIVGALGAVTLSAAPAQAQWRGGYGYGHGYGRGGSEVAREMRECRRELRRADSRWEYHRELRECRREIARARWEDRHDRWYGRDYRDHYRYRGDWRYRRY